MKSLLAVAVAMFLPAVAPAPQRSFHVRSVEPVVVGKFALDQSFVIGGDGIARACPDLPGVQPYVRVETAKQWQNAFFYLPQHTQLISHPETAYTLACLKVE